jgi:hypothetical protein
MSKFETQHNHELGQDGVMITEEQKDLILNMHETGIQPAYIYAVMLKLGVQVTTRDIYALCRPRRVLRFHQQCRELFNWVSSQGGQYSYLLEPFQGKDKIVAVFTILPSELLSLQRYGDLIQIDGTHPQLSLRWEVIPVTMLDNDRRLACGGIFFAAYLSTEIVKWLLTVIWQAPGVADKWRVLLTDEDSAFIPAFDLFRQDPELGVPMGLEHRLCGMHKKKNFVGKVLASGLRKEERAVIGGLFDIVAYGDNRTSADAALKRIEEYGNEKLNAYIRAHIKPHLNQFSRSHLGDNFGCGVTTTSNAESMNRMIKYAMVKRRRSLLQAREHFTNRIRNHDREVEAEKASDGGREWLFRESCVNLGRTVSKRIDSEMERAGQWKLEQDDNSFRVRNKEAGDEGTCYFVDFDFNVSKGKCECHLVEHEGIPCSHIIAVHQAVGVPWSADYIHPRWIFAQQEHDEVQDRFDQVAANPPVTESGTEISSASDEEEDVPPPYESQEDNFEEGGEDRVTRPQHLGINEMADNLDQMSSYDVYLALFHFAKSICATAAVSREMARHTMTRFRELMEFIQSDGLPNEEHSQSEEELEAAPGHPPGRPRRCQVAARRASGQTGQDKKCPICSGLHSIDVCPHLPGLEDIRRENMVKETPHRGKRCKICCEPGHTAKTCKHYRGPPRGK